MDKSTYSSNSNYNRKSKVINLEDVYEFALRCAILAYMEQQTERRPSSQSLSPANSTHKERHYSLSNLADRFSDDTTKKSDKLTRDITKSLIKRLDEVIQGKDMSKVEYLDKRFRTVAEKIKKHLQHERRYRKSASSINDIVIMFLKNTEEELKTSNDSNPASWYNDLNRFLAKFVDIVINTLQKDAPYYTNSELIDHLSNYCTPTKMNSPAKLNKVHQSDISQFQMVLTIKSLFQKDQLEIQDQLSELLPLCTESALLHDLKKCINNVHTNQAMKKEDFPSIQAYENWRKREVKQLTELMNTTMLMNSNLSIGNSSEVDVGSANILSRKSTDSLASISTVNSVVISSDQLHPFTFIPNNPKGFFQLLMKICLDHDIEKLSAISEIERAKTNALSQQSHELLRECWKTWRLSSPYRATLYLGLVKKKVDQKELEFTDIFDAFRSLDKVTKENNPALWAISEKNDLIRTLNGLSNSLLRDLAHGLSEYWKINPTWIQDIVELLEMIYNHPVYMESNADIKSELLQLEEPIKGAAVERWVFIKKLANEPDDFSKLFTMADRLTKDFVLITKKKFTQPLMGILSIPSLVMARQMPYFALEIENWAYSPSFKSCCIDQAFELYEKVLRLEQLYDKYGPETKTSLFEVESWFLPHVKRWLLQTNESTIEWVRNAISQDLFRRYNETELHSSSVIDLFSMFTQAVSFIAKLQWPNEPQYCSFMTYLSRTIVKGIEEYCCSIEDLIRKEVVAKRSFHSDVRSSITLLDRARHQITGGHSFAKEKNAAPFSVITPTLCTQLNNLEAARGRLDNIYQEMHGDAIAACIRANPCAFSSNKYHNQFLYTIRIVRAENLQPMDKNGLSDPYVIFQMNGQRIAKTSTVYETLNPRWDEEFDIWYNDEDVDVIVSVVDEDVITSDEECGNAWFTLSPRYSDFYQKDDLVLNLSPQGTLVLRVTVESEKNDIQFCFGRAFRTLKASENDAVGWIADQMVPYIRHCLSRPVIRKLLGRDKSSLFSAFSRRKSSTIEPDLQACEDAIAPLLDFLEYNLTTLNNNLTEPNLRLVVLKIWDLVLKCLDKAMLPPLSEYLSQITPLDDYELHVVLKWLELLKILFNGGDDGDAIPLEELENTEYYSILAINAAYRLDSQILMDDCQVSHQRSSLNFNNMPASRSKSVYHSKNTIRQKKKKKEKGTARLHSIVDLPQRDDILRILRMRHDQDVAAFLHDEFDKRSRLVLSPAKIESRRRIEFPESLAPLSNMPPPPLPSHGVPLTD